MKASTPGSKFSLTCNYLFILRGFEFHSFSLIRTHAPFLIHSFFGNDYRVDKDADGRIAEEEVAEVGHRTLLAKLDHI